MFVRCLSEVHVHAYSNASSKIFSIDKRDFIENFATEGKEM